MDKKNCPPDAPAFPIRELSARTGVNSVTLRAWERRYGLLKPARTAKGHRLYTEADCERVQAIMHLISRGVSVGQVKQLLDQTDSPAHELPDDEWCQAVADLLEAAAGFSAGRIEALYNDLTKRYPLPVCIQHWLQPVLESMSLSSEPLKKAQLAFLWSVLVQRLVSRLQMLRRSGAERGKVLMIGDYQDTNWRLWLAGIDLAEAGYDVQLLDPPPLETWPALLEGTQPEVLVCFHESCWTQHEAEQLEHLAGAFKKPVIVAGLGGMLAQQRGWLSTLANIHICAQPLAARETLQRLIR